MTTNLVTSIRQNAHRAFSSHSAHTQHVELHAMCSAPDSAVEQYFPRGSLVEI